MKTLNINPEISEMLGRLTAYTYSDSDTYLSAKYDGTSYVLYKNYLNGRDEYTSEVIYEHTEKLIFIDVIRNLLDEERHKALMKLQCPLD